MSKDVCLGINGQHAHLKGCDGTTSSICRAYSRNYHRAYDERRLAKIYLRTNSKHGFAEWQIQEIEEQLKWNKDHIHLGATA